MLIGNLTRDPELTATNSGVSVCRFSLAVPRRFANADNGPQADFFNIVVWRGQAENCHKFLKKGSKCCIIGKIQNSSYEKDGQTRYTTDIVADEVEFLGGRNDAGDVAPKPSDSNGSADLEPIDDDSLPF
jgi:single-strand DNA-binding protein